MIFRLESKNHCSLVVAEIYYQIKRLSLGITPLSRPSFGVCAKMHFSIYSKQTRALLSICCAIVYNPIQTSGEIQVIFDIIVTPETVHFSGEYLEDPGFVDLTNLRFISDGGSKFTPNVADNTGNGIGDDNIYYADDPHDDTTDDTTDLEDHIHSATSPPTAPPTMQPTDPPTMQPTDLSIEPKGVDASKGESGSSGPEYDLFIDDDADSSAEDGDDAAVEDNEAVAEDN